MKRLFYLVVIIALPLIIFFQYHQYRRFHPPTDYVYETNAGIDTAYYDQETVFEYHEAASKVGNYARYCWSEHGIDVRFPDYDDPGEEIYYREYETYLASAKQLEGRLVQSANWKKQGYTNGEIQALQEGSKTEAEIKADRLISNTIVAQRDDENAIVYEIQRLLMKQGYQLPVDGLFRDSTELCVRLFQEKNDLYANGIVDKQTLTLLLKD